MNWKDIITDAAPLIGTALGGPEAGAAIGFLAHKFLGRDGTPEDIAKAILEATPEQLIELKKIDNEFYTTQINAQLSEDKIDYDDRDSARKLRANENQTGRHNYIADFLAVSVTLATFAFIFLLIYNQIPAENRDLLFTVGGMLLTKFGSIIDFHFGSSHGSRLKDLFNFSKK